tara:strand:- start:1605 stop:2609 length:1005 start_codon:yes stop_codon:yes gene_type:complete
MKVFITGIAGFLGSHLAERCLKKNHEVSGCDNLIGGDLSNLNNLDVTFHKVDIENLDKMSEIMKGVDVVCHAASYAHEGLSSVSPKLICQNNLVGSVSVFTASVKNNVKRIVYCSSMARYGELKIPFKESDKPHPVDPYGVSKLAAENILKIMSKTYKFEYNIAVPHNIIGPKQKYNDPFRNVASIMINLILQNRQPIIYGDGNQKRCFSDIDDCIVCLEKMMFEKDILNEIINIGPDEEFITINHLYNLISNKLKFNKDPKYMASRPNEVYEAMCSSDKARELLDYKTTVSLNKSMDKMIKFIKSSGTREFEYNYPIEIDNNVTPDTWSKKLF